jgi:hypothetical protein
MQQNFQITLQGHGSRVYIAIPFDPNGVWGSKERHYVTGTINGIKFRGLLSAEAGAYVLPVGAAWRRDSGLAAGDAVTVSLTPEGPQQATVAPDVAAALASAPAAATFFNALATFYRKNYMRWIESAKRPETRAARISEMIGLLQAGRRQK